MHQNKPRCIWQGHRDGAGEAVEGDKERGQLAGLQAEDTRRESRKGEVEPRKRQRVWVSAEREEREQRRRCEARAEQGQLKA